MAKSTRAEWARRVERWKDSGLTAKEFAAELDITASSLTFWKWKLRKEAERSGGHAPSRGAEHAASFLQLVPSSIASASASLEIVLKSGIALRVPQDFHEPTLLRLLDALAGR